MNSQMRQRVVSMLNEQGIETKGQDGKDYVFGMEVVTDDRLCEDIAYLE